MPALTCRKCFRPVHDCPVCKGKPKYNCTNCRNTGQVCAAHGGYWK